MKRIAVALLLSIVVILPGQAQNFLKGKVLKIDMSDTIAEKGSESTPFSLDLGLPIGGFDGSKVSLLSLERALEKAAKDDDIAMVYLNYDKLSAGTAALEELRECLAQIGRAHV